MSSTGIGIGDMRMGKILVLGASGFIGSRLVQELLKKNCVVGYSRTRPAHIKPTPNYTHIYGDFSVEKDFVSIIEKNQISCIYHCISTTTPREGTAHIVGEGEDNIIPSLRLLEAASKQDGIKLIFLSSGGTVYGENMGYPSKVGQELHPICTYGIQKRTIEEYLRYYSANTKLDGCIARISNPYGVMEQINRTQGIIPIFLKCLQSGQGITLFGDTVRDYIHIDDVVTALIAMKDYNGGERIFNIGSGCGVRLSAVVAMMEQITGKTFTCINHQERRACDVQTNLLDISVTQSELGWVPAIQLRKGIARVWKELFHLSHY